MKTLILIAVLLMFPVITLAQEKQKEKFQSEYSAVYSERQIGTISGTKNDETEKMNGLRITVINTNSDYIPPTTSNWTIGGVDYTVKYLVHFRHDAKPPSLSGRDEE